jgi:hypothetical protein
LTAPTPHKLDGVAEAKLIAMRLGKPPAGYATVHRLVVFFEKSDLDLNAGFVPQQWAWNRSSRKN